MPTTPVGQIPYPQPSDKPLIPTDMKNLATVADNWISVLDAAFTTRMGAISSRLDAVTARLAATSSNLATANSNMTAGDASIVSNQNALAAVENRLATQDATDITLQNRFNTDSGTLTRLTWDTPRGVIARAGATSTLSTSDTAVHVLRSFFIPYDTTNATVRVFFSIQCSMVQGQNLEYRILAASGNTTPAWTSYLSQLDYQGNPDTAFYPFSLMALATNTGGASGMTVALACQGGGSQYQTFSVNANIQHLTGNV